MLTMSCWQCHADRRQYMSHADSDNASLSLTAITVQCTSIAFNEWMSISTAWFWHETATVKAAMPGFPQFTGGWGRVTGWVGDFLFSSVSWHCLSHDKYAVPFMPRVSELIGWGLTALSTQFRSYRAFIWQRVGSSCVAYMYLGESALKVIRQKPSVSDGCGGWCQSRLSALRYCTMKLFSSLSMNCALFLTTQTFMLHADIGHLTLTAG